MEAVLRRVQHFVVNSRPGVLGVVVVRCDIPTDYMLPWLRHAWKWPYDVYNGSEKSVAGRCDVLLEKHPSRATPSIEYQWIYWCRCRMAGGIARRRAFGSAVESVG